MEVLHRAVTVAQLIVSAGSNCFTDICFGLLNRRFNTEAVGQIGGDGRRQGTAGSMVIMGFYPIGIEWYHLIFGFKIQPIGAVIARKMPTFNQNI